MRGLSRHAAIWQLRLVLAVGLVLTNLVGAVVVYCLAALVVPLPPVADEMTLRLDNLVLTAMLVPAAVVMGVVLGNSRVRQLADWLREDRRPNRDEQLAVLRLPRRMFWIQGGLWGLSAVVFGVFNGLVSLTLGLTVGLIVLLAGLSTSAVAYLVTERVVRPFARRALSNGVPDRIRVRSVAMRSMLAWLLGTGVSALGIVLTGLAVIVLTGETTVTQLSVTMVVLGGIVLVVGAFTTWLAARASSDPVRALRRAVAEVAAGRFDVEVPIYDGTEIGILQAGFNEMVGGLQERERIRDLFGRHVGDDVARAALQRGVSLGGETREVAVLFVDIIGSTGLATDRPPDEVVSLLNRFFDVVIEVVHAHDGWINKFEGDAALAIWGAPAPLPDMTAAALRAARLLGTRLRDDVPELAAGIGVSAGVAVAGNVGAATRYEYTVIGDPVNEAARLTELAKDVPGRVVARGTLLDSAGAEADHWRRLEPVTVRGRTEPTPIAAPAAP